MLLVRGPSVRTKRDGERVPAAHARRPHGARRGDGLGRRRRRSASSARAASSCACAAATSVHPALGRAAQAARAAARRSRRRSTSPTCSTARRARPSAMEADLRELIATVQNPHLRALLDARARRGHADLGALPPRARRPSTTTRPTAHGLLEHSLTVAQAVSAISATFPGIDRDVAVTGALLHDIGKLEAYTADPRAIDLTDAGQAPGRDPARLLPRPPRDRGHSPGFPPELGRRPCCTSSSATTARSSTAAPSSRARARRRSCT